MVWYVFNFPESSIWCISCPWCRTIFHKFLNGCRHSVRPTVVRRYNKQMGDSCILLTLWMIINCIFPSSSWIYHLNVTSPLTFISPTYPSTARFWWFRVVGAQISNVPEEKRCRRVNVQGCVYQRKQIVYKKREETSSLDIVTE